MASVFNPDTFMNTVLEEANETSFVPVPEGEYVAVIKAVKARSAKESAVLDVTWGIDDPEVAKATGFENPQVRQSVFLDVTEQGGLDMGKGKNIHLGRLREAVGQNQKGKPWQAGNLIGQVAKIKIAHRTYEGEIQADVKGVQPI